MKRQYAFLVGAALILLIQHLAFAQEDSFKADGGMTWPMLPHESIAELSAKFYPSNTVMQQRFIAKTLQLNQNNLPALQAKTRFTASTAILIPNLKSLASGTKAIKLRSKKTKHPPLQMTYNIKATLETLPQALVDEYEQLLTRNEALKTNIAALDERLRFLQNKLASLKALLQQLMAFKRQNAPPLAAPTVVSPAKAEAHEVAPQKPQAQILPTEALPAASVDQYPQALLAAIPDWLKALLLLLLAVFGIQFLLKKRQQRVIALLTADSIMPKPTIRKPTIIDQALDDVFVPDIEAELAIPSSTQVDEYKERSILEEAKAMVQNGANEEAISHLKWAIRAQPKIAIGVWLYLLAQLRAQNLKEEFERYAFEMHQTFNVMTPLWNSQKLQEIVVAESLENFRHITKQIIKLWPAESCKQYLQTLITDNRSGERLGFSQEVVDEVLFLIELQEVRLQLDETETSI